MSEGLKYDEGKPRMDLLDPSFTKGVASVLTFGANKYSQKGECDCRVKSANEILKYGPKDFVSLATTLRANKTIESLITSTNESIEGRTSIVLEHIKDNIFLITPESLRRNVGTLLKNNTDSQTKDWMNSLLKIIVRYVDQTINFASITAMQQVRRESDFVRDVISHLDSLKKMAGQIKHTPTCQSTVVIRSGADNWRGGIQYTRIISAIHRHLAAIQEGEDIDPESGLPHVYHIGCNVQFLGWMMQNRPDMDDRYKTEDNFDIAGMFAKEANDDAQ
jgi:hypothetical protein